MERSIPTNDFLGYFISMCRADQPNSRYFPLSRDARMQRARTARQELTSAEKEVETAKSLCERWRVEEDAAIAGNARLQVCTC